MESRLRRLQLSHSKRFRDCWFHPSGIARAVNCRYFDESETFALGVALRDERQGILVHRSANRIARPRAYNQEFADAVQN